MHTTELAKHFTDPESGITWLVRIVRKGDRYGREDCLVHERALPLLEFYDGRYPDPSFMGRGQFVSRYYLDSLWRHPVGHGLYLQGDVQEWRVGWLTLKAAMDWAAGRLLGNP